MKLLVRFPLQLHIIIISGEIVTFMLIYPIGLENEAFGSTTNEYADTNGHTEDFIQDDVQQTQDADGM